MKREFLGIFSKNIQTSNFMKTLSVGAELLQAGRWTDRHDEANSRFSPFFANAPTNGFIKRSVRTLDRNGRNFVSLNQAFPWTGEATFKVRTTVGLQIVKMVTHSAYDKTFKESSFDIKAVIQIQGRKLRVTFERIFNAYEVTRHKMPERNLNSFSGHTHGFYFQGDVDYHNN